MPLSLWQSKRQLPFLAAKAAWAQSPFQLVYEGGQFVSEDYEGDFVGGGASFLADGPLSVGTVKGGAGSLGDGGIQPFCRVATDPVRWDQRTLGRIDRVRLRLWSTAGGGPGQYNTPEGAVTQGGIDPGAQGNTSLTGYDTHGINMSNGSLRNPASNFGQGYSQGRDVDELISQFMALFGGTGLVDSLHGMQGLVSEGGRMETVSGSQLLRRSLSVEVTNAVEANYYHAPYVPTATPGSSHSIILAWTAAPARYDSLGYAVYRGANPGDPAPPYGEGVLIGTTTGTTLTDTTIGASGLHYNYSVFATYAETPQGQTARSIERVSAAATAGATST